MKTDLERRVRKLEEAHRPVQVPVDLSPLTEEEMETRYEQLQQRAALGDLDARWRVERIRLFIQKAQARAHERRGYDFCPEAPA